MRNLKLAFLSSAMLVLASCATVGAKLDDTGHLVSESVQQLFSGKQKSDSKVVTPGEASLAKGIEAYDAANYPVAESDFNNALALHLNSKASQIEAHKYLAFIACTSAREILCRSEFRKVLELDPGYVLEPAEAGHPLWGPVFRSVKAETDSVSQKK